MKDGNKLAINEKKIKKKVKVKGSDTNGPFCLNRTILATKTNEF